MGWWQSLSALAPAAWDLPTLHGYTALPGDTFVILNLAIEKMMETPKLHSGKKKRHKLS